MDGQPHKSGVSGWEAVEILSARPSLYSQTDMSLRRSGEANISAAPAVTQALSQMSGCTAVTKEFAGSYGPFDLYSTRM